MATEKIKRSKVLAEIRDDIRALSNFDFDSATYDAAVLEIKRKVRENMGIISSIEPNFKSIWHDIRHAYYFSSKEQIQLFSNLANTLDKLISDEIKSESQSFSNDLSVRIKSFSSEAAELMKHISDVSPEDIAQLSPEISCILSEISSQIDELLRAVDAM